MSGPESYLSILEKEFLKRQKNNPLYSLRAFARDLELAPSHLSGILKGKLGLSNPAADRIGKALGFSFREIDHFKNLVASKHARSRSMRKLARGLIREKCKKNDTETLSVAQFQFISEWHHLAILELFYLKKFIFDERWMAIKLGLLPATITLALERLNRLKIIQKKNNVWKPSTDWLEVIGNVSSAAIQEFHRQIQQKSIGSIKKDSIDVRDMRCTIMAIRKEKIKEAKSLLEKFHSDLNQMMSEGDQVKYEKDEVYCLHTSFFPLTKKHNPSITSSSKHSPSSKLSPLSKHSPSFSSSTS